MAQRMSSDYWAVPPFPLAELRANGGFAAVFRRIACIGDSLSSGELQSDGADPNHWHDYYEYAWGQYIARMTGAQVYNFSKGGLTAQEYCEGFASFHGFWDRKYQCQAYIMALGANDLFGKKMPVGSVEDICLEDPARNAKSFAGYFGRIIQQYKKLEPNACFFLITFPMEPQWPEEKNQVADAHAKLMYEFAELFSNTYVIDLRQYGPVYDKAFKEKFFMRGHMNPAGYYLTAVMVASYIDYIIRSDFAYFAQVGFIGTPYYLEGFR